jgi:homoserine dehydrogenase
MKAIRIGLLGCGTVGGGVVQLLHANASEIAARVGAPLEIAMVAVRDVAKTRATALDRARVVTDPWLLMNDDAKIDVIVETMGGLDPTAALLERALERGPVVTANKMLLATHGAKLLERAKASGHELAFEGAVGGGIPIIRVLREALVGDTVESLRGIVNGTCNFILTKMSAGGGASFDAVLAEAQALGYAEAEPSLDIDGHDAAQKLAILALLAFGAHVDASKIPTEGIRNVAPIDHQFAARFGFAIKHLAVGRNRGSEVELRVHPSLVHRDATLANVNGVLNAIAIEGRALGPCLLSGRGAGANPTAVSVLGDIVDVARSLVQLPKGTAPRALRWKDTPIAKVDASDSRYYLRFQVFDRPGVLAKITGALGDARVSIEQMVQQGGGDASGAPVQVVLMTHAAKESAIERALASIASADFVAQPTRVIRVEEA